MKVLLVYPVAVNVNPVERKIPALSLVYLASSLEKNGHKVQICDTRLNDLPFDVFDVVGITCSVANEWLSTLEIAARMRKFCSTIVLGGIYATYNWKECLKHPDIDYVVLGEGELAFAKGLENFNQIDGIASKTFYNPKERYNFDLDSLPFPAWHLTNLKKMFRLQQRSFGLAVPHLSLLTSRGCPQRCRFCNMYLVQGRKWRPRSVDNVLEEVKYLKSLKIDNVCIVDDNFNVDLDRAKGILEGFKKLNIKYHFPNGLHLNTLDEELVKLMQGNCLSAGLAVESGSERIRNTVYRKNLSFAKITQVFDWFKKYHIPTIGFFMIGAPSENDKDFRATQKLVSKLPMNLLALSTFTPYPGAELYEECKVSPSDKRIDFYTPVLNAEEVRRWRRKIYFSFINHHKFVLLKEFIRPNGVLDIGTMVKFIQM